MTTTLTITFKRDMETGKV